MATTVLLLELAVVLAMIFIGARMGGIGLGIFGMLLLFWSANRNISSIVRG